MKHRSVRKAYRLAGGMCLALLVSAGLVTTPAVAAPSGQIAVPTPTPTPTPTSTPISTERARLPSPTGISPQPIPSVNPLIPSPTLQPPPDGGGRVAVNALFVRADPQFDGRLLGVIPYNQSVYPIGRNANTTWVAINWSDAKGWVYAGFVQWSATLDLEQLPVLAPANLTPYPTDTAPAPALAGSPTASQTPTQTPSPSAQPTSTPSATATVAPSVTAARPAAIAPPAPTNLPISPAPSSGSPALPAGGIIGGGAALGVLALGLLGYGLRRAAASRESRRYQDGFVLSLCPICLEGHVHLEEVVRSSLGIQRISRSARCDNCLSVLRGIKPGLWRYVVDPYVDQGMVEHYNNHRMTDDELRQLAKDALERRSEHEEARLQAEPPLDLSWLDVSYEDQPPPDDADPGSATDSPEEG